MNYYLWILEITDSCHSNFLIPELNNNSFRRGCTLMHDCYKIIRLTAAVSGMLLYCFVLFFLVKLCWDLLVFPNRFLIHHSNVLSATLCNNACTSVLFVILLVVFLDEPDLITSCSTASLNRQHMQRQKKFSLCSQTDTHTSGAQKWPWIYLSIQMHYQDTVR